MVLVWSWECSLKLYALVTSLSSPSFWPWLPRYYLSSFNLILQHLFLTVLSALRSRLLGFSFSFVGNIYKGRSWNIDDWLQPIKLDAQPLRMEDAWKPLAWLYWCVQRLALGACTFCPFLWSIFSPPPWTLKKKKLLPWCTFWAGSLFWIPYRY